MMRHLSLFILNNLLAVSAIRQCAEHPTERSFANEDTNATSGFVVPDWYIFTVRKLDPKVVFKRVTNGNQEANALAVDAT